MKTVLFIVSLMSPTYEKDMKPIFMDRCYNCHNGVVRMTNWADYQQAYKWRNEIAGRVVSLRSMPPNGVITEEERILIERWVTLGAKK